MSSGAFGKLRLNEAINQVTFIQSTIVVMNHM